MTKKTGEKSLTKNYVHTNWLALSQIKQLTQTTTKPYAFKISFPGNSVQLYSLYSL